jgi:hypothetical protein
MANPVDLNAYHYVVSQNNTVSAGKHPVAANMRQVSGTNYAMHTGGFNSFSVGISFAGQRDATPANPNRYPLLRQQVDTGLIFVGLCCNVWDLDPANVSHLFTHREAFDVHGVKGTTNHTKQDIVALPFLDLRGSRQVGDWLRSETKSLQHFALGMLSRKCNCSPGTCGPMI